MIQVLASDALPIDLPATALRFVHIGAAILAAGGACFQLFALHPALGTLDASTRKPIREAIAARWRGVVFACIALLLISGLTQFVVFKLPEVNGFSASAKKLYHSLFGLKVLAALGSFHAASVLALPGPKGERYRDNAGFWLKYLVGMLFIVVLAGTFLRYLR